MSIIYTQSTNYQNVAYRDIMRSGNQTKCSDKAFGIHQTIKNQFQFAIPFDDMQVQWVSGVTFGKCSTARIGDISLISSVQLYELYAHGATHVTCVMRLDKIGLN